jgi:UDP-GlcNAc3NAcA epimerase
MIRVATIVGARPQFIKSAVVSMALRSISKASEILIHTGQHYDVEMSDIFFKDLCLPIPDHNLGIGSGNHGAQTGRMLEAIEEVLLEVEPDWVLVFGDTNSTLAGALAAAKIKIPIAHIEAGLRSFNHRMPEEINRVLVDHCSSLLLAPTQNSAANLRREGLPEHTIKIVGDVMYDAALYYEEKASRGSRILETLSLGPKSYVLATVHRAENTDDPVRLERILEALARVSNYLPVVLPMHPRTRKILASCSFGNWFPNKVRVIAPVGYLDMIQLEKNASVIATDSGGVQKEAFFFKVRCVTLREETEWTETIECGANQLVGIETDKIERAIRASVSAGHYQCSEMIYGEGDASAKIAQLLIDSILP